MARCALR